MANTHNANQAYGGIISALQAVTLVNNKPIRGYPENYDGIISAILDLGKIGDAGTGEYPPGWNEEEGIYDRPPNNGDLWFDKRQGRLMCYVDDAYYQANGADQLTAVGETAPDDEVTGAFWYNPVTGTLFIYDGTAWIAVVSQSGYSTGNIPLELATQTEATYRNGQNNIVSDFTFTTTPHQADLNRWIIAALSELDADTSLLNNRASITYDSVAPNNPDQGDLWYNTTISKLQVYTSSNTWVNVIDVSGISTDIQVLQNQRAADVQTTTDNYNDLDSRINALPFSNYALQTYVDNEVTTVTNSVNTLTNTVGDLSRFALATDTTTTTDALDTRITTLESNPVDLTPYATSASVTTDINALRTEVNNENYATQSWVNTAIGNINIPDISGKVDTSAFTAYQTLATNTFFPKAGGELNGTFTMNKLDIANPSFDFSSSAAVGEKIFKLLPLSGGTNYSEFGTNSNHWEIAWDFGANEDFCYKHATAGKVFSITSDGATATELRLASFGTNDANGQVANNVIDVRTKLTSHDTSIASLQTAVNALNAPTTPQVYYGSTAPTSANGGSLWFDSANLSLKVRHQGNWVKEDLTANTAFQTSIDALETSVNGLKKIYYGDNAPTGTFVDGDMWFKSDDLRLNVRHGGAWVSPDRVEDTALKTAIYNAVDTSTDYASLKTNLLAALA